MRNAKYESLMSAVRVFRSELVPSAFGPIPKSVAYLEGELDEAREKADRAAIFVLLVGECSRSCNDELYLFALRRRAIEFSDDPISLAGLAFGIAVFRPTEKVEAADMAKKAIECARQVNRRVRYSATNAIRIGLMIDNYNLVDQALDILVSDKLNYRLEDTPYEFDFIDKIDKNKCNSMLLQEYRDIQHNETNAMHRTNP